MLFRKYGKLTFLKYVNYEIYRFRKALFQCDCGNKKIILISSVRSGNTKSCGCYNRQIVTKHGMSSTSIYKMWRGILNRCLNPKSAAYKNYGGRGITICKRWMEFENFYKDMGIRPGKLSIDRIDNNKGYCKNNCKWASSEDQCNNTRSNIKLTYKGITLSISQWARKLGVKDTLIRERYYRRWPANKILTTPSIRKN